MKRHEKLKVSITRDNLGNYFKEIRAWHNSLSAVHCWGLRYADRDCEILKDYLFSDKPQRQIARENNLSSTRASQILYGFLRKARQFESAKEKHNIKL